MNIFEFRDKNIKWNCIPFGNRSSENLISLDNIFVIQFWKNIELIIILGAVRPLFFIMRFFLESIHWKDMEDYALHWSIPLRSLTRFVTSRNRYGTIASLNFTLRFRILTIFTIWWSRWSNYVNEVGWTNVRHSLPYPSNQSIRERIS